MEKKLSRQPQLVSDRYLNGLPLFPGKNISETGYNKIKQKYYTTSYYHNSVCHSNNVFECTMQLFRRKSIPEIASGIALVDAVEFVGGPPLHSIVNHRLSLCVLRAGFIFISMRCFWWARPIHGQAAPGIADEATRCCVHISRMPFIVEDSRNITCWSLYITLSNTMRENLVKSCLRDITSCLHDRYKILAVA